jgi:hypothetical protein
MYLVVLVTYFGMYGLAAVVSMLVEREDAPLMAAVCGLFHAVTAGSGVTINDARKYNLAWIFELSYNRWATEALYTDSVSPFAHVYDIQNSANLWGFRLDRFVFDIVMGIFCGIGWRIFAYILISYLNKDKRR